MGKKIDVVGLIMAFEQGELNDNDTITLFAELVRTGQAWSLQGSYGRGATSLIEQGYISKKGKILKTI